MPPMIERFTPRSLGDKTWGIELLIAHTEQYIGKVLFMRAGESGPLQYHTVKDEAFHLFSGLALVTTVDEHGARVQMQMHAGETYHIPPGAVHQVSALATCVFFEVSTPVFDDRVNVEALYP